MQAVLPGCAQRGVKVISNAGGINPRAARDQLAQVVRSLGLGGLRVAAVQGDDTVGEEARRRIAELRSRGISLSNLDNGEDLSSIQGDIVGLSVYLGARPIVQALERGAQVVLTGRYADASLWMAPLIYEFGWGERDWDRLAFSAVVGHLLECTGMVSGGCFTDWHQVPALERLGYPIAEVYENAEAVITKVEGSGGMVSPATVKSQLVYEIGDPTSYLTPDVIADFTSVQVKEIGRDQVKISGIRGRPAPDTLKAVIGYHHGFVAEASIAYAWPEALEKAQCTAEILRHRFGVIGIQPLEVRTDFIGSDSLLGELTPPSPHPPGEVMLRMVVRVATEAEASRFLQEIYPLYVAGPPGACGIIVQPPRERIAVWPTLIPREEARSGVEIEDIG